MRAVATPPSVEGFSESVRTFPGKTWLNRDTLLWGGGLTAFGLAGLLVSAAIAFFRLGKDPVLASWVLGGGGALCVLLGVGDFLFAYFASRWTTWVFPEGIIRRGMLRTDFFFWSEVEDLTDLPNIGSVNVRVASGRTIAFPADSVSAVLYRIVRDQGCARLVPRVLADLRAGKTVTCGPVRADADGIRLVRRDGTVSRYAWDEVSGWFVGDLGSAWLVTARGTEDVGVKWHHVPNLTVVLEAGKALGAESGH